MANLTDYGFPFNSVGADRKYSADVFRKYFKNILEDGVIEGFTVEQNSTPNKTVQLNEGIVFIQGIGFEVDTPVSLVVADNISGNPRIDRVVLRVDYTDRLVSAEILQGTPAVSPVAPSLTRDDSVYELSLAQVLLINGYTTILDSDIADERLDEAVCGYCKTTGQKLFENENDFSKYQKEVISVDAYNKPTQVDYTRDDDTLAIRHVASNPDSNGFYQTVVETYYDSSEVFYKTITYTLTFLSTGIIDTMSRVVS